MDRVLDRNLDRVVDRRQIDHSDPHYLESGPLLPLLLGPAPCPSIAPRHQRRPGPLLVETPSAPQYLSIWPAARSCAKLAVEEAEARGLRPEDMAAIFLDTTVHVNSYLWIFFILLIQEPEFWRPIITVNYQDVCGPRSKNTFPPPIHYSGKPGTSM